MQRQHIPNENRKFAVATSVPRPVRERLADLVNSTGVPLSEILRNCIEMGLPLLEREARDAQEYSPEPQA